MKSKFTTAILAFLLGGFGIHRFYLGQTGKGFLCLLFCWTFIPAVIAFFDFFIFLFMSENTFNMKYNNAGFYSNQ
ncbi:MAG TPA: TM2 domain-containing protein [Flavobacterium sp.]|jgi:TM2 domain-containing membrane protein YozV